jgi:hypothetical protein
MLSFVLVSIILTSFLLTKRTLNYIFSRDDMDQL